MSEARAKVGDIVWYRPATDDPRFHNQGWREVLPAVVVKVWDAVENLQVLPSLDIHVLQDAQVKLTFVPFVKCGPGVNQWSPRA